MLRRYKSKKENGKTVIELTDENLVDDPCGLTPKVRGGSDSAIRLHSSYSVASRLGEF